MPTARAITTSPASLLQTHFVLCASIPIAFAAQQQHTLSGHTSLPLPKPANKCRCLCLRKPSADKPADINDEDWIIESQR